MSPFIRFDRLLALALLGVAVVSAAVAHPAAAGREAPSVPSAIEVPAGNKLFLVGHAVGVQIYACDATSTGFGWRFVAPRADLYDNHGKLLTTHFGGPTWQARDGSFVMARRVDGVTVDAAAIPWLLLSVASEAAGSEGDRLVGTTYIQRIATTGGLAPAAADCNETTAGSTEDVPYTADYYFWKATGS